MDFLSLAKSRQSVREYCDRSVDRQLIDKCCEAARIAPSACNGQPWSFHILDNKDRIAGLRKKVFSGIYSISAWASNAPVIIAVAMHRPALGPGIGGRITETQYNLIDVSIAADHFVLQATEIGLGTCWIGWFNREELQKAFGLEDDLSVFFLLTLGYPVNPNLRMKKRKPVNEIQFYL